MNEGSSKVRYRKDGKDVDNPILETIFDYDQEIDGFARLSWMDFARASRLGFFKGLRE